ncbi:hypothetical protein KSS87_000800 [Heliosperma pusillum]|nr:hypothetical protein KSS87_000800 [Heliosperma pusillum]
MKDEVVVEVRHHHHHKDGEHKEEEEVKRRGCRPIAFLLSVPFAICGVLLSLAGAIVWILGSLAELSFEVTAAINLPSIVRRSCSNSEALMHLYLDHISLASERIDIDSGGLYSLSKQEGKRF